MIFCDSDLDGVVSAYIASHLPDPAWLGHIIPVPFYVDRNKVMQGNLESGGYLIKRGQRSAPEDPVIFVDMGFENNDLEFARGRRKSSEWIWIDHHTSSRKFNGEIFDSIMFDDSGEVCAADLTYEFVQKRDGFVGVKGRALDSIYEWLERAHDRDLWINKERELNRKLDAIVKYKTKSDRNGGFSWLEQFIQYDMPNGVDFVLSKNADVWKRAEERYQKSLEFAQNTKFHISHYHFPIMLAYASSHISDVADEMYDSGEDIICLLNAYPPDVSVSMRCKRDGIDLLEVAHDLGGGGHRQAAAFVANPELLKGGYEGLANSIKKCLYKQMDYDETDVPF